MENPSQAEQWEPIADQLSWLNMAYLLALRVPYGGAIHLRMRHFKLGAEAANSQNTVAINSVVVIFSVSSCKPPMFYWYF